MNSAICGSSSERPRRRLVHSRGDQAPPLRQVLPVASPIAWRATSAASAPHLPLDRAELRRRAAASRGAGRTRRRGGARPPSAGRGRSRREQLADERVATPCASRCDASAVRRAPARRARAPGLGARAPLRRLGGGEPPRRRRPLGARRRLRGGCGCGCDCCGCDCCGAARGAAVACDRATRRAPRASSSASTSRRTGSATGAAAQATPCSCRRGAAGQGCRQLVLGRARGDSSRLPW